MPSHRLITSGSLRLLETALLENIQQEKRGDPLRPVVVLCGSGFLGHYLSRELVRRGSPHLGVSFLTFNGLAETLSRRVLLEKNLGLLPAGGKNLVARQVVRDLPPQSYFARVQDQPHLPQVLATTFTDIEDSRIDFPATVKQAAYKSAVSQRKIGEVAQLYGQYRGEFRERMLSEAGLLAEAGQQGTKFESLFGTGRLFVYGFYELTGAQYELLTQLAAHVEAIAFLLFQPDTRFGAAQRLRAWWQERASEEVLSSQFSVLSKDRQMQFWALEPPSDLEILQANVLRYSAVSENEPIQAGELRTENRELRTLQDDGSVRVLSCPNEVSEAREIAREAVRLKRDAGIPFSEMAVLARDPANYLPLLAGVFARAGLPYYVREGLPLSRVAAGRSILAALRLPQANYARAEVMQWLTSGALAPRALATAPSLPALSLWDRISAEAGIIAGEAQWRTRLQAQLARYRTRSPENSGPAAGEQSPGLEYRREQTETLLSLMERLFAAGEAWQQQRTWTGLADAAAAFLRRFYPNSRERGEIEDALFSLCHLDLFGNKTTLEEFVSAAEAALAERSCQTGNLQQTGVHLLSLAAARHTRFRVVFIPGLTEGSFPTLGRQDPILLDEERRELSAHSAGWLPLKGQRPQEENLLFLLALEAARERLVLTTARADATSGTEKITSYFLLGALECLAGRPISSGELNRAHAGVPRALYVSAATTLLVRDTSSAIDTREFDLGKIKACLTSDHPESSRYLEASAPNFARALEAEQALAAAGRNFTVYEGLLATPECRQALSEMSSRGRVYSATALERYAACPYHYFLNDVLRLKELEDPNREDELAAHEKGKLIHAILRDFYFRMKAQRKLPLEPKHSQAYREALTAVCEEHFLRVEREGIAGWVLQQQLILQDLERHLEAEMEREQDWLPADFERSFGQDDQSPLAIPIGGWNLQLRGQIDRLDLSPDQKSVRIVDYKSGSRRHKLQVDLAGGTALQLPLYLLAATMLYPGLDLRRSSAEYCYVTRAGEWRACTFSGAELLEKQDDLFEILETIVTGIREGIFPRCPDGKGAVRCDGCEYSAIGDPRRQAKLDDPRLDAFRRMRAKV